MDRTLLLVALAVLTLTAGCSAIPGTDDPTPTSTPDFRELSVTVVNEANATQNLSARVTLASGTVVHDQSASVDAGFRSTLRFNVPAGAELEATLAAANGTWQTTESWNSDQCDPMQVDVTITNDGWSSQSRCVPRSG